MPVILAILGFLTLGVAFAAGIFPGVQRVVALVPAVFAVFMIAMVVGSVVLARRHAVSRSALALDAIARGFAFTPELRGWMLPGILFRAGENVILTDVIDARTTSTPFVAGSISGTYGPEARVINASFLAIPLARPSADAVLLATGCDALTVAGFTADPARRIALPDDFDKSFALYSDDSTSLEMFTPELLQLLLDSTDDGCDVELVDEWMFVYSRDGRYGIPRALDELVTVTERVQGYPRESVRSAS